MPAGRRHEQNSAREDPLMALRRPDTFSSDPRTQPFLRTWTQSESDDHVPGPPGCIWLSQRRTRCWSKINTRPRTSGCPGNPLRRAMRRTQKEDRSSWNPSSSGDSRRPVFFGLHTSFASNVRHARRNPFDRQRRRLRAERSD